MFVDSHCHINFDGLADRLPEVLDKMRELKVTHALCVSVDLESLPSVLKIAEENEHIYASVGVHPDHEDSREPSVADLVELAQHPKVVAIGETGLDYYRLEGRSIADMEWQRERSGRGDALLYRAVGHRPVGACAGFLHFAVRHRYLQEREGCAGRGHAGAARPAAHRNRFAVPRAGAVSRKIE